MSEFHLPCNQSVQFEVMLGNDQIDKGQGLCEAIHYSLQGIDITTDFLSYNLKGVDMILGMAWLYPLGWTCVHWQKPILKFRQGGETITLQGDQSLYKTEMSINEADKELTKSQLFMVELHQIYQVAPHTQSKLAIALEDKLKSGFPKLFAPLTELPPARAVDHSIPLVPDAQPVNLRPYKYSHVQRDEIEKLFRELLDLEFIKPSHSPFASPILLVKKNDASWRFCVDYRALNKITVPNCYPILVVELLDELHGAVIFSKLDLKSGYHQIRMTDQDRHKTAFKTHEGHYEFQVMPFGLMNAPATFQSLTNSTLHKFLRHFVLVFVDDILVFSKSLTVHEDHPRQVFQVLDENDLHVNPKKCHIACDELEFLGHWISGQRVGADKAKVESMISCTPPPPQNIEAATGLPRANRILSTLC